MSPPSSGPKNKPSKKKTSLKAGGKHSRDTYEEVNNRLNMGI
jgi:hypothetical protein